ncbi:hypothetical protein C8R45DRAFT_947926 [Mycena sanguinolenta]|nr:hypothetical protein C8R45DRAFT_947926 [Mycena sanguinolenta]
MYLHAIRQGGAEERQKQDEERTGTSDLRPGAQSQKTTHGERAVQDAPRSIEIEQQPLSLTDPVAYAYIHPSRLRLRKSDGQTRWREEKERERRGRESIKRRKRRNAREWITTGFVNERTVHQHAHTAGWKEVDAGSGSVLKSAPRRVIPWMPYEVRTTVGVIYGEGEARASVQATPNPRDEGTEEDTVNEQEKRQCRGRAPKLVNLRMRGQIRIFEGGGRADPAQHDPRNTDINKDRKFQRQEVLFNAVGACPRIKMPVSRERERRAERVRSDIEESRHTSTSIVNRTSRAASRLIQFVSRFSWVRRSYWLAYPQQLELESVCVLLSISINIEAAGKRGREEGDGRAVARAQSVISLSRNEGKEKKRGGEGRRTPKEGAQTIYLDVAWSRRIFAPSRTQREAAARWAANADGGHTGDRLGCRQLAQISEAAASKTVVAGSDASAVALKAVDDDVAPGGDGRFGEGAGRGNWMARGGICARRDGRRSGAQRKMAVDLIAENSRDRTRSESSDGSGKDRNLLYAQKYWRNVPMHERIKATEMIEVALISCVVEGADFSCPSSRVDPMNKSRQRRNSKQIQSFRQPIGHNRNDDRISLFRPGPKVQPVSAQLRGLSLLPRKRTVDEYADTVGWKSRLAVLRGREGKGRQANVPVKLLGDGEERQAPLASKFFWVPIRGFPLGVNSRLAPRSARRAHDPCNTDRTSVINLSGRGGVLFNAGGAAGQGGATESKANRTEDAASWEGRAEPKVRELERFERAKRTMMEKRKWRTRRQGTAHQHMRYSFGIKLASASEQPTHSERRVQADINKHQARQLEDQGQHRD